MPYEYEVCTELRHEKFTSLKQSRLAKSAWTETEHQVQFDLQFNSEPFFKGPNVHMIQSAQIHNNRKPRTRIKE